MDSNVVAALSSLLGAIVGGGIAYFATRRLNREQIQLTVKVQLNDRLHLRIDTLEKALNAYGSVLTKIGSGLEQSKELNDQLWRGSLSLYVTSEEISNAQSEFCDRYFEFTFFLEQHEVVLPSLKKFRTIIGEKQHELSELYFQKLSEKLRWALPLKRGEIFLNSIRKLSSENVDEVRELLRRADILRLDIVCYLYDLSVYAQNTLLGKLFNRTVTGRKPPTAKHAIIEGNDD